MWTGRGRGPDGNCRYEDLVLIPTQGMISAVKNSFGDLVGWGHRQSHSQNSTRPAAKWRIPISVLGAVGSPGPDDSQTTHIEKTNLTYYAQQYFHLYVFTFYRT